MKCIYCNNEVPPGAAACPICHSAITVVNQVPPQPQQPAVAMSEKSRITYALLGFFFGFIGVHNFYAGYSGRGVADIFCSILLSPLLVQINTGIELLTTTKDRQGNVMPGGSVLPTVLGILLIVGNLFLLGLIILIFCGALALS